MQINTDLFDLFRDSVAHQGNKANRAQLAILEAQAQMVFLELMDRLELQEEMV